MRATPWVELDFSKKLQTSSKTLGDIEFSEVRSPYELPLSLRVVYDEERERAAFEFRYAFEEAGLELKADGATIVIGHHSARLLRVEVSVSAEDAESPHDLLKAAAPAAVSAIQAFRKNPRRWRPQEDNLSLAEVAIQSNHLKREFAFAP